MSNITKKDMTQEEKQLLLIDLSARLSYGVKVNFKNGIHTINGLFDDGSFWLDDKDDGSIEEIKPYLRPMSSMTEEECDELSKMDNLWNGSFEAKQNHTYFEIASVEQIDWLNAHHFDYRGLIEKGLAIEAPERMYKM